MKFSGRAKLALAAALLASLGVKAAVARDEPAVQGNHFNERAVERLRADGFVTREEHRPFATLIHARSGACQLMITDYPPQGTLAEPLAAVARPVGRLRYVWRGEVLDAPPRIVPLMSFLVKRELRRIGFRPSWEPLVAVAANPACNLGEIDWSALATFPS